VWNVSVDAGRVFSLPYLDRNAPTVENEVFNEMKSFLGFAVMWMIALTNTNATELGGCPPEFVAREGVREDEPSAHPSGQDAASAPPPLDCVIDQPIVFEAFDLDEVMAQTGDDLDQRLKMGTEVAADVRALDGIGYKLKSQGADGVLTDEEQAQLSCLAEKYLAEEHEAIGDHEILMATVRGILHRQAAAIDYHIQLRTFVLTLSSMALEPGEKKDAAVQANVDSIRAFKELQAALERYEEELFGVEQEHQLAAPAAAVQPDVP